MKALVKNIIRWPALLLILMASMTSYAAPVWEKVASASSEMVENINPERIDVKVVDTNIILSVSNTSQVKVFTILGQLVAQQQLEPGVWTLSIPARGIYILKVGSTTRRITI